VHVEQLVEPRLLLLLAVPDLKSHFISQICELTTRTQLSSIRDSSSLFIGRMRRHTFTLSPCL